MKKITFKSFPINSIIDNEKISIEKKSVAKQTVAPFFKILLLTLGLFFTGIISTWGQNVSTYTPLITSGTYSAITGTTILAANTDDGNSNIRNIGFTFNLGGQNFTQFVANSNGHIRLGATAATSSYSPLSTTTNTYSISAAGRDGRSTGGVIHTVSGSAPNRISIIQYTNYDLVYNATTARVSFQIRLYETTNVVEIIYNNAVGNTTNRSAQVGIRGTSTTDDTRNFSGTSSGWAALTAGTDSATASWLSTSMPSNGRILRWSPPVACSGTPNSGTATISSGAGCSGSSITLSATGLSSGSGISYQWESGPTSTGPWTNISGATNNSANITSVNGTTFYRITTTCTSSGLTNSSNSVSFTGSTCGSVNIPSSGSSTVNCGTSTYIYDNGGSAGNYVANSNGYIVLDNSGTGVITLTGSFTYIEGNYDYLRIYSGVGTSGTLLATYSNSSGGTITPYTSPAGTPITIQFTSDTSVQGAGFALTAIYSGTCASCLAPTALTSSAITSTSATISWTASSPAPASGYEYYVSTSATAPTAGTTATGSSAAGVTTANLTGLTANTTYYFWVRSNCGGDTSSWVSGGSFYTGYCLPSGATNYYLTNVVTTGGITNISNASGAGTGGYTNYSSTISCSNYVGATTSITLTPSSETNYFYCWIDWNNDFDFNDANETIFATTTYTADYTGTITIPAGTAIGNYRMRVANSWLGTITSCGPSSNGEYEDYTFTVVAAPSCIAPTALTSSAITSTSATISWTAPATAPSSGYQYYYSTSATAPTAGTTPIGNTAAGVTTANLTGLTANTTYYFWVRSNCGATDGTSTWAGSVSFTTLIPAPANDDCSNAQLISVECSDAATTINGTTLGATEEAGLADPTCDIGTINDVWYTFNSGLNTSINLSVTLGTASWLGGEIHTTCGNPASGLFPGNCDFNLSSPSPTVISGLMPNTTYRLRLFSNVDYDTPGTFTFTLTTTTTPTDVVITASDATVCKNTVQALTATGGTFTNASIGASSGTVNLTIPDANLTTGASQNLTVSGIPANATITKVDVLLNITHTWLSDLRINLEAPNGQIINLINQRGGSSDNFTNTIVTSNTGAASLSTGSAPFTGTFTADLANQTTIGTTPAVTTTTFSNLFAIPNGTWKVRVYDNASGDIGTLNNCSILITYDSDVITWSPTTDLYTDETCTTAYTGGHTTNLWAKPTATRTYTATSTLGSCEKTDTVTLTVESATYNGSWSSAPAANKELVFNGDFSSTESLEGCSCTVNSGNVVINSNHTVKLLDEITVNGGSITFENNSSLIQINDVSNSGSIIYKRTSPEQVLNTDYVYWSSPVSGTTVPGGLNYVWNNGAGASGNWASAAGQTMTAGQGVIMRGIGSRTFTGVPHNGEIMVNVHRRNLPGYTDNWNLIGNPYPSAISAIDFLTENQQIEGSIAIWTHNSEISNNYTSPFYGNFTYNYNPQDYIIYNISGPQSGPEDETYRGFIPAGQAFFVKYENDDNNSPTAETSVVKFQNNMRTDGNGEAHDNTQFYRNNSTYSQETIEKNRIWIDIVGASSAFHRTLVGYIETATDGKDRLFDATTGVKTAVTSIYSLIGNDKMCIQGKGLPFSDLDEIPMGYNAGQAGNFTIAIHAIDGLFFNQDIFLFDTELNITHNLKLNPYVFSTIQGENNTRFRLIFNDQTLSNPDFDIEKSLFIVNKNKLEVISNMEQIEAITVFDLLGRTVYMNNNVNNKEFVIPVTQEHAPLIVKIKLANGIYVERKTLY